MTAPIICLIIGIVCAVGEFDLWLRNEVARGWIEFNAYIGGGR